MIERYSTPEMVKIWSDRNKFEKWLEVELSVLRAKSDLGILPLDILHKIAAQAKFEIEKCYEYDIKFHHDVNGFIEAVRDNLDEDLKKYLHADMTSYDTQEPANAMLFLTSIAYIEDSGWALMDALGKKARQYKDMMCIGRTHGQHAEPMTVGLKFLNWRDMLDRALRSVKKDIVEIGQAKISGAVGTYTGGLTPEIEQQALSYLSLSPAPISTQIMSRDRHARVMNWLAVVASVIDNIALQVRLLSQTELREMQEPFGKDQKGSSRMPHKKNPIRTENLCGLSRVVRTNALVAMENIATWHERDISHSAPERIIFADSFNLVHFMLKRLNGVIERLVVNEDMIKRNLEMTQGTVFSPDVNEMLMAEGIDPKKSYRISQDIAFRAIEKGVPYLTELLADDRVPQSLKTGKLQEVLLDPKAKIKYVDHIFQRVLHGKGE